MLENRPAQQNGLEKQVVPKVVPRIIPSDPILSTQTFGAAEIRILPRQRIGAAAIGILATQMFRGLIYEEKLDI